jgi:hypothetical protein
MKLSHVKVGVRVRSLVGFYQLPKGSVGVIDEDYGSGVMVKWDGINIRDGFDKETELDFLEAINPPLDWRKKHGLIVEEAEYEEIA